MPSKDSKIVSARIPNDMEFGVSVSKILSSVYAEFKRGNIGIDKDGIVLKQDCENCTRGLPIEDEDGEWVRDMAHDLNIDVKVFKKKIEQGMRV